MLLSAAWQVYIWPLIGLFLGSFFGDYLITRIHLSNELFALPFAILGAFAGFSLARKKQLQVSKEPQWLPILINVQPAISTAAK